LQGVAFFLIQKFSTQKMCNATSFQSLIDNGLQRWGCCIFFWEIIFGLLWRVYKWYNVVICIVWSMDLCMYHKKRA